jgi:hypothetical protein
VRARCWPWGFAGEAGVASRRSICQRGFAAGCGRGFGGGGAATSFFARCDSLYRASAPKMAITMKTRKPIRSSIRVAPYDSVGFGCSLPAFEMESRMSVSALMFFIRK